MDTEKPTDRKNTSPDSGTKHTATAPNPFGGKGRQGRLSSLMAMLAEWFATIIMVVAFFLFLIWGATFVLPEGTSLLNLDGSDNADKEARNANSDIALSAEEDMSDEQLAAILSEVHKTVKHKSAKTISWAKALQGISLFDQDAVKTASASHAVIQFDESNTLQLGPDSLVIVRRLEEDPWLRERRSALVIMEGELRGSMVASLTKEATNVEVIIPGGVARISRIKGSDEKTDYQIKVNPDESTSIVVYRGNAEVEAQNKKVELGANQLTIVVKGAAPSKPVILPDNAKINSPADGALAYYRDFPQEITFDWEKTKEGRYRLEIARDVLFEEVVLDEIVTKDEFIHGDLHDGSYFWRVASVTADGTEGQFSKSHRIEVIQDMEPPRLSVNYPDNAVKGDRYLLNGSVESGATLIVNGMQVNPDALGRFEVEVKLKKGMNVVVAQAVDAAGNATFVSKRVTRDF